MLVTEFAVDELEALLRVLGRHKKFLRRETTWGGVGFHVLPIQMARSALETTVGYFFVLGGGAQLVLHCFYEVTIFYIWHAARRNSHSSACLA
jgi:hypothetical protein